MTNRVILAAVGDPMNPQNPPIFPDMELKTLAEVDVIRALPEGGYEVQYFQREQKDPSKKTLETAG